MTQVAEQVLQTGCRWWNGYRVLAGIENDNPIKKFRDFLHGFNGVSNYLSYFCSSHYLVFLVLGP